jgi:Helix-turn-helix domain
MNASAQLDLLPREKAKIHHGGNGIDLSYWTNGGAEVRMPDGDLVHITKHGAGPNGRPRYWALVTAQDGESQKIHCRSLKSALAQLALIAQNRALNKSIQIKLKQQDDLLRLHSDLVRADALASVSKLEAKNAQLRDELTTFKSAEFESKQRGPINTAAVRWAYAQEGTTAPGHSVLIALAMHADRNYRAWPSAETISMETRLHRDTVRAQITALIKAGKINDTGERLGTTGQVKVFGLMILKGAEIPAPLKRRRSCRFLGTNEERTTLSSDSVVVAPGESGGIAAEAATPTIDELIKELQRQYPPLNVAAQFEHYRRYRERLDPPKPPDEQSFRKWMADARIPLKRSPKPKPSSNFVSPAQSPQDDVGPEATAQFQQDFERYKLGKHAKQSKQPHAA